MLCYVMLCYVMLCYVLSKHKVTNIWHKSGTFLTKKCPKSGVFLALFWHFFALNLALFWHFFGKFWQKSGKKWQKIGKKWPILSRMGELLKGSFFGVFLAFFVPPGTPPGGPTGPPWDPSEGVPGVPEGVIPPLWATSVTTGGESIPPYYVWCMLYRNVVTIRWCGYTITINISHSVKFHVFYMKNMKICAERASANFWKK